MPKKQKTPRKSDVADIREGDQSSTVAAKSASASPAKTRKTATKSSARTNSATRKPKGAKAPPAREAGEPSVDQIQLRAYFISEHRQRLGAPGDHHSDWLEARRQLIVEARRK